MNLPSAADETVTSAPPLTYARLPFAFLVRKAYGTSDSSSLTPCHSPAACHRRQRSKGGHPCWLSLRTSENADAGWLCCRHPYELTCGCIELWLSDLKAISHLPTLSDELIPQVFHIGRSASPGCAEGLAGDHPAEPMTHRQAFDPAVT